MQREILQEKSLSRSQGNAEKSLNVDLSAKSRLIPYSTAADMLSLNDLYLKERDACENYRMIFTVNPVCTNVLFNAVTEPVYGEGSASATSLVQTGISRNNRFVFPYGVINQSGKTGDTRDTYEAVQSTEKVDEVMAVRDTEFSHKLIGDIKYHCGYDIFNNHLLRTQDFQHIQLGKKKVINEDVYGNFSNERVFNTIFDRMIDYAGNRVRRVMDMPEGSALTVDDSSRTKAARAVRIQNLLSTVKKDANIYQLDNIKTMNQAFYDEMRLVDGWYGFYNSGYINIPNARIPIYEENQKKQHEISLNHILNNEISCGFIDMYPDRTLYSFIPKVNRFRKRLERNWDCTISYPYENDYDMFALINQNEIDAVRILTPTITYNNVGDKLIRMQSLLRHTLQPGDEVRIYYKKESAAWDPDEKKTGGDGLLKFPVPVEVMSVGDSKGNDTNRYFSIRLRDIETFCDVNDDGELVTLDASGKPSDDKIVFFYRKIDGGYDNKYYFRKFKKIKDFEYKALPEDNHDHDNEAVVVKRAPTVITEDSPDYIKFDGDVFEKVSFDLGYTQNKIAFSENIYGDRVAQVIFNNDICVSGLKDNLGRPLSTVYFTAVKTNRGHKEWYDNGNTSAETVEFSHCFGEVNSGLDLPVSSGATAYNVRKLYSVFTGDCTNADYTSGLKKILEDAPIGTEKENYNGTPKPLEIDIKIESPVEEEKVFDEFFGDVVEFSAPNFLETPIEKVYHRFNTAQRECVKNSRYFDINYDEVVGDQHDITSTGTMVDDLTNKEEYIVPKQLNVLPKEGNEQQEKKFPGNIQPEGYYYSPFYPVMLKELDDEIQTVNTRVINFNPQSASIGTITDRVFYDPEKGMNTSGTLYTMTVISPVNYNFIANQPFTIYDILYEKSYRGYLDSFSGTQLTIATTQDFQPKAGESGITDGRYILALNLENSPEYAEYIPATQKIVWRAPKKMSELTNTSPIYNMPFTNGRLYIHSNVNVFVKRQDPTGKYMLYRPSQANPLQRFKVEGRPQLDFDYINYITDTMLEPC